MCIGVVIRVIRVNRVSLVWHFRIITSNSTSTRTEDKDVEDKGAEDEGVVAENKGVTTISVGLAAY